MLSQAQPAPIRAAERETGRTSIILIQTSSETRPHSAPSKPPHNVTTMDTRKNIGLHQQGQQMTPDDSIVVANATKSASHDILTTLTTAALARPPATSLSSATSTLTPALAAALSPGLTPAMIAIRNEVTHEKAPSQCHASAINPTYYHVNGIQKQCVAPDFLAPPKAPHSSNQNIMTDGWSKLAGYGIQRMPTVLPETFSRWETGLSRDLHDVCWDKPRTESDDTPEADTETGDSSSTNNGVNKGDNEDNDSGNEGFTPYVNDGSTPDDSDHDDSAVVLVASESFVGLGEENKEEMTR
ncbi:hypothetical protein Cpir12675_002993 [Ceratocystis pirilliformis]|uniref:Uncharacterized protein n=1 Tax=Ceratocystis pirilliformis TaxID=259994 RepID=A0ABR3Z5W1_9PEZI